MNSKRKTRTAAPRPPPTEAPEALPPLGMPGLALHRVFDRFDAKVGIVTDTWLAEYARRARTILEQRSARDIQGCVLLAEWMLQQPIPIVPSPELLQINVGASDESSAHILRRRMAYFDLEGGDEPPGVSWPEIFSALALANVASYEAGRSIARAMHAVEAVCIAETLRDQEHAIASGVKQKIFVRARTGGLKKGEQFWATKKRALEFWAAGNYKTYAGAARAFLEEDATARRELVGGRAERTVAEWLSAHEKLSRSLDKR